MTYVISGPGLLSNLMIGFGFANFSIGIYSLLFIDYAIDWSMKVTFVTPVLRSEVDIISLLLSNLTSISRALLEK